MLSTRLTGGTGTRHARRRARAARRAAIPVVLAAAACALPAGAQEAVAATYTVTTDNGVGAGSLRASIIDANANPGTDTIAFAIPGAGRHTITPTGLDLPTVTDPLVIDGFTQPGSVPAAPGVPAELMVVLNARNTTRGLELDTDDSTVRGLAIHSAGIASGQPGDAIRISGDRHHVEGNHLGVRATGGAAGNASNGVEVAGDDNRIGGAAPEDRNVISDNGSAGVAIAGDGNRVRGNTIGTDPEVTLDLGNDAGVSIIGDDNQVGGSALAGAGNLISGNETGVEVTGGVGNEVEGNLIGTDATGATGLVPGFFAGDTGVHVHAAASGTVIGRATDGTGNVLGGHADEDVLLTGDDNVVQGNMIGTNAAGDAAIDSTTGVYVRGDDNLVGGVLTGEGNVISGHRGEGVNFRADPVTASPAQRNRVEGNLIGTDATGTLPLPNGGDGVELVDASDTSIGGTVAGAGNVIAANEDDGVRIRTDDTAAGDRNAIVGNTIGTNAAGADLGNGGTGVRIEEGNSNRVGSADPAVPMSTIAFNGGDGVAIEGGGGNAVVRTETFGNGGLGIDLEGDGVTANDPPAALDADFGANGLQNFPVLGAATTGVGGTTVDWTIDGLPLTQMRVEFYANDTCTAPDPAEGQAFLGSVVVTTDALGHAEGSTQTVATAAVGQHVTATASVRNPPRIDATSEFSACVAVT